MIRYTFLNEAQFLSILDLEGQITGLYRSNGWWGAGPDDPELIRRIVKGSHCFITAEENDRVIGMGRAISDGASDAYIQDVTVVPDHRGRGIGSEMIRRIVARLEAGGVHWIGLIAEKNSHPFYESLGFLPMADAIPMLKGGV